ncbi:hypothetical protein [Streptomyces sp. NBC_00236]|uniref:hypothetical protein n=1 Tax=unclassified Streptomyces TaxID=2593676 RepID=UPI002E292F63|nr:hypothetical protein [Streptomyces sp. NBC_00236]
MGPGRDRRRAAREDPETACTTGYGRRTPVVRAAALALAGLAVATGPALMLRHRATAAPL